MVWCEALQDREHLNVSELLSTRRTAAILFTRRMTSTTPGVATHVRGQGRFRRCQPSRVRPAVKKARFAGLNGARIKCKKCGNTFLVSPPAGKAVAAAAATSSAAASHTPEGIQVEGLEMLELVSFHRDRCRPSRLRPNPILARVSRRVFRSCRGSLRPSGSAAVQAAHLKGQDASKDKFDLTRLEEVINQYAKQGWTVKAMTLPHIKGYGGVCRGETVRGLARTLNQHGPAWNRQSSILSRVVWPPLQTWLSLFVVFSLYQGVYPARRTAGMGRAVIREHVQTSGDLRPAGE